METKYSCGIDIGSATTENTAIIFISREKEVIIYKGNLNGMTRYQEGKEPTTIAAVAPIDQYNSFVQILGAIPEFMMTTEAIIEMQVSQNDAAMSRYDGMLYGFIAGRYPHIRLALNIAIIRKKFITDRFAEEVINIDVIELDVSPKPKEAKIPSMKYAMIFHPKIWDFMLRYIPKKMDDISDAIVYADLARFKAHVAVVGEEICSAMKKSGDRCTNKAKFGGLCGVHGK